MSFTTGKRVTVQKPCKANADMDTLIANAEDLMTKTVFSGIHHSDTQSMVSGVTTTLSFANGAQYDTDSYFNFATNPTRFTIPSGVAYCQMTVLYEWGGSVMTDADLYITKNGSSAWSGMAECYFDKMTAGSFSTAVLAVVAGDYFEIVGRQSTGSTFEIYVDFSLRGWKS